jgi:hypothetical protein
MEKILNELINAVKQQTKSNWDAIVGTSWRSQTVAATVQKRELERSADYAEKHMQDVTYITSGHGLAIFDFLEHQITSDGHIAEFGVYKGESINHLASIFNDRTVWGFDSFWGLEENFSIDFFKGGFSLKGIPPIVKDNVSLVKGSFANTLPIWLEKNPGSFSFIHIDCDTYESTKTVLNFLGPTKIVAKTFIVFDEYFGFAGWKNHEFKAWQEYCYKNNTRYKYVAVCGTQVLVEIL